jgi:hypothetical protein
MNGSRSGLRRDSTRSWPATESENNYQQLWGSAWGDYLARTDEPREPLKSTSMPMQTALRSAAGRKWIAGGTGQGSVTAVICCAAM